MKHDDLSTNHCTKVHRFALENKNFSLNRIKLFEHLFTDYQYIILCFYCILLLLFRTLGVRWLRDSRVICLNQSLPQIKISPDLTFLTKSSLGNSGLYHLYDTILPCSLSHLFIISFMSSGSLLCQIHIKKQVSGGSRLLLWHP